VAQWVKRVALAGTALDPSIGARNRQSLGKEHPMFKKSVITVLFALLALVVPTAASAATSGAIVFSKVSEDHRTYKEGEKVLPPKAPEGGLFAVKDRHLNQLTEDPADSEPSFSADGHTIAFVRDGDVWAMRADGSGQRQLTAGIEIDSRPLVAPNGRYVLFQRQTGADQPRDLYTVKVSGGLPHKVASSPNDEHEASFSPDGRTIAFVRTTASSLGGTADDIYTVKPSGAQVRRLTHTPGIDEFAPSVLNKTIVYSRGENSEGPSAYADIYAMDTKGQHGRKLIAGAGSAYVEDVTANGRTILFRRDQGLWVKQLGGKGRKLADLPDNSQVNSVFSSDGKKVASFTATGEEQSLSVIDVATGRRSFAEVVGYSGGEVTTTIGPIVAWQPVPHR
jgi:Tol biopolymer transport system component